MSQTDAQNADRNSRKSKVKVNLVRMSHAKNLNKRV